MTITIMLGVICILIFIIAVYKTSLDNTRKELDDTNYKLNGRITGKLTDYEIEIRDLKAQEILETRAEKKSKRK